MNHILAVTIAIQKVFVFFVMFESSVDDEISETVNNACRKFKVNMVKKKTCIIEIQAT